MTFFVNTRSSKLRTNTNRAKLSSSKAKSMFIKVFQLKAKDTNAQHKHKHIKNMSKAANVIIQYVLVQQYVMIPVVIPGSFCNGVYEVLYDMIICKVWKGQNPVSLMFCAEYFVCIMHGIGISCFAGRDAWFYGAWFCAHKVLFLCAFFLLVVEVHAEIVLSDEVWENA